MKIEIEIKRKDFDEVMDLYQVRSENTEKWVMNNDKDAERIALETDDKISRKFSEMENANKYLCVGFLKMLIETLRFFGKQNLIKTLAIYGYEVCDED